MLYQINLVILLNYRPNIVISPIVDQSIIHGMTMLNQLPRLHNVNYYCFHAYLPFQDAIANIRNSYKTITIIIQVL